MQNHYHQCNSILGLYLIFLLYGNFAFPKKSDSIFFLMVPQNGHQLAPTDLATHLQLYNSPFSIPIFALCALCWAPSLQLILFCTASQRWLGQLSVCTKSGKAITQLLWRFRFINVLPHFPLLTCRPLWYFTFAEIVEKSTNHLHFPPAHEQT